MFNDIYIPVRPQWMGFLDVNHNTDNNDLIYDVMLTYPMPSTYYISIPPLGMVYPTQMQS